MLTQDFYKVIDAELEAVADRYKAKDSYLKKVQKDETNRKSYAFLIWFLEIYAKIIDYGFYITDSTTLDKDVQGEHKDIDASCDIVFDSIDKFGNKTFYVVQSKWNVLANCEKEISTTEVSKTLHDFSAVLAGDKKKVNPKLASKLDELNAHIKNNGEVKFILLCLCKTNHKAEEDINNFIKKQERTTLEVIDIDRLKIDYIDRNFKKINPINPLRKHFKPDEEKITLRIERLEAETGNFIKINTPYKAYVFLVRPKVLHDWFDKYGFLLFYKNVRNPLLESHFNKDIEKTALDNSQNFWYYNNGITAITYSPFPDIRKEATEVELNGLQVINGAQTVYSIYHAYKNASPTKQIQMDDEVLITLRLLRSGGEDFDLKVTRYTNSQNPIEDRDFKANDAIQERLQRDSFDTKYWYAKRRGEFRTDDDKIRQDIGGITVIENTDFALAYLAYHLQEPALAYKLNEPTIAHKLPISGVDYLFLSHKEHQDGIFEKIFNDNTKFEDMLCGVLLWNQWGVSVEKLKILEQIVSDGDVEKVKKALHTWRFHIVALFKVVLTQYLSQKTGAKVNVSQYLLKTFNESLTYKILTLLSNFMLGKLEDFNAEMNKKGYSPQEVMTDQNYYEKLREELENKHFTVEDIDNIELEPKP